jgi:predicted alpha/beta-fold hydrolase
VEFRDVEITTPDGVILRAWYMRPQEANGDAVILLRSITGNRVEMYDYGKWLVENHYSVLLPDERHHGDSGGLTTYGIKEADDIHRWVDWIETNEPARCVYGLGESTGAAELLESLPHESRFCAVVGESANATFREEEYTQFGRLFHTGPWLGRTFFRSTVDVGFLYVRLRYGFSLEAASPEQAVVGIKTPILLIHGLDDRHIPPYNSDLIKAKNPSSIVVWKMPGALHVGAHAAAPTEFERRVLEWFASHSAAVGPTSGAGSN